MGPARPRRQIFVRRSTDSGAPASLSITSTGDSCSTLGADEEEGLSRSPERVLGDVSEYLATKQLFETRRDDSMMGTAPYSARDFGAPPLLDLRAGRATTSEARVRPPPLPMGRVNERTLLPPMPMSHTPPQGLWPLYRPEDAGVAGEAAYASGIEAHKPRGFTPRGVPAPVAEVTTPRFDKHVAQWNLWESRWERQERELGGAAGRGSAQLVMNSMEEYKDRIVFQDLLEESRPQHLSDNLKFATDCRAAGQYFIPLGGVALRPFDLMTHWLPIRVRTEGGRIVSAAKYRRASLQPSPNRAMVRAESPGPRHDYGSRAVYSPEPRRASEMDRWKEPEKEHGPLMQGAPAYVKARLGDGRKHTVVDGKIRLLKQGANPDQGKQPEQILYEMDGLVSGFARERELRLAELAARGASTRDESSASQLTSPPNPTPLVLSATRLSFVSAPGVGREQILFVTNASATTLLVSAHHMAAAPLPAPEGHQHGLAHEEEAAEAARGGAQDAATDASVSDPAPRKRMAPPASGRPSAPPFVLATPESYVLPGATAGFRVVFTAELAGSYTHSFQLRTTPAAGLAPVAVELSAKCLAAAPDTKAMRDLEAKLARRETLGFIRELVLRALVAPAAEQGARRVRVAEGLAEPPEPNAGEAALGVSAEEAKAPAKGKKPPKLGRKEQQEAEAAAAARAAADAASKAEAATRPPAGVDAVWWARERDWGELNPELPFSRPLWSALERVARAAGVVGWTGSLEDVEAAAAAGPLARALLGQLDALLSDASSCERGPEPRGRETLVRAAVGLALLDLVDASLAVETLRATQLAPFAAAPHGAGLTYGGVRFGWSWEELCYLHEPETEGAPRKRLACAAPPPPPPESTPAELAAMAKAKRKGAKEAAPRGEGGKTAAEPLDPPELVLMPLTTAAAGARPADAGPPFRALLLKLADSIADVCVEAA